jgi:hypothetical protein
MSPKASLTTSMGVLNRTVSKSRLSAVQDTRVSHPRFDILRYVGGATEPLELYKSSLLLTAQQKIDIEGDRCRTVTYQYRLQRNHDQLMARPMGISPREAQGQL